MAINEDGHSAPVPPIEPETEAEQKRYEAAAKRREVRLVLAGRISLQEVTSIKVDMLDALRGAEGPEASDAPSLS